MVSCFIIPYWFGWHVEQIFLVSAQLGKCEGLPWMKEGLSCLQYKLATTLGIIIKKTTWDGNWLSCSTLSFSSPGEVLYGSSLTLSSFLGRWADFQTKHRAEATHHGPSVGNRKINRDFLFLLHSVLHIWEPDYLKASIIGCGRTWKNQYYIWF